ncbi:NAD(P)-binding protein [Schizophyllum commune H4-8]|uniref:NAD(P)-binding protein n=1 Tax=Schizophyllum commune (strain H4-8 / FGSC 9210) TaxID=578458 RepID=UPI00215E72F3|nr:NAD(P)-binding protein [Schizophyllum commune H4-8]KAI5892399.1 NAD(P)-binding protein [Schizophyllum commune H4-8]
MGKYPPTSFLWDQLSYHSRVTHKDLTGQIVVVIGANVGLGYEAAKHFATMGAARVIMGCRSNERGTAAVERLQKETGSKNSELMLVDLADFSSTMQFAAELEARVDRLDLLVLNAGVTAQNGSKRTATVDGWEPTIQVNVVSSSILAILLLPIMVRTSRERHTIPRTVVVASSVHFWAPPWANEIFNQPEILKALSAQEEFEWVSWISRPAIVGLINLYHNPFVRYEESKLLNVLFARALNERLRHTHPTVIVNSVDPGLCSTSLFRDEGRITIGMRLMNAILAVSAEVGSRELVWAALGGSENADALRGAFVARHTVRQPSDFVLSERGRIAQDRTWREIVAIGEKLDPKVRQIVKDYLLDL